MSTVEIKSGRKLAVTVPFNNKHVDPHVDLDHLGMLRDEATTKMKKLAEANGFTLVVVDESWSINHPDVIDSLFLPEDVDPDISIIKFTGLATNA